MEGGRCSAKIPRSLRESFPEIVTLTLCGNLKDWPDLVVSLVSRDVLYRLDNTGLPVQPASGVPPDKDLHDGHAHLLNGRLYLHPRLLLRLPAHAAEWAVGGLGVPALQASNVHICMRAIRLAANL